MLFAAAVSVSLHGAAVLLLLLVPYVFAQKDRPRDQGTVELLMVERKGAEPASGLPPDAKNPPSPPASADVPGQDSQPPAGAAAAAAVLAAKGDEPASQPMQHIRAAPGDPDARPALQGSQPTAEPARPQEAPVFHLEGTDSESNAIATGDRILPAMPDNRFRNRPPVYPADAQMHGEHGAVVLVIHVSANGTAAGAEVVASSGVESLDQAARTAVLKWHFHPALHDGRTVAFDMPFRFVFENE